MVFGFQAAVEYKGRLFFSEISGFGLFAYDYNDKNVEFCTMFEEIDCFGYSLHRKAFLYGNEAWFIPQVGEYISCVNLDNYKVERIHVDYNKKISRPERLFTDGLIINNKLVCAPFDIDTLVIIDLDTHIPYYIHNFIDPEDESIVSMGVQNSKVIFYPQKGEYIRFLDVNDGNWTKERRYDMPQDYGIVAIGNEGYLFSPGKKKEFFWRGLDGVTDTVSHQEEEAVFCGYQQVGNNIVFFPYPFLYNKFVSIDKNSFMIDAIIPNEEIIKDYSILIQIASDSNLLLSSGYQGRVFKINIDTLEISSFLIEADSQIIRNEIESKMDEFEKKHMYKVKSKNLIYENDWKVSLDSFLDYIKEND